MLNDILAAARAAAPRECCGLLLARCDEIVAAAPVANIAVAADRFDADPFELAEAERRVGAAGLTVAGYYHSHPHGAPTPSVHDRAGRAWPDLPPFLHLIVTPSGSWALYDTRDDIWKLLSSD